MDDIICLYQTDNQAVADLMKAHLDGAGIPCFLEGDGASGTLPYIAALTGIKIMIRKQDLELAKEILTDRLEPKSD